MPFSGDFNPNDFNPADFFTLQVTGTSGPPVPRLRAGQSAIGLFSIGVSPIGDIPAFSFWDTVISQYANSPIITGLIQNWFQALDQTADLDAFFDNIMNIDTAQGYGLDLWGRILGVSRVLTVASSVTFGFQSQQPTVQGFNQAPFFTGQQTTNNFTLSDASYRILLIAKALANITNSTIPALNQILLTLFPGRGNAFVTDAATATNLILQSNNFSAAQWVSTQAIVATGNFLSPDGTNDAWLWERSTTGVADTFQPVFAPAVPAEYTFSLYGKLLANSGRYLSLFINDGITGSNNVQATFDLLNGVVSIPPAAQGNYVAVSAKIQNAGGGWYRCSLTFINNTSGFLSLFFSGSQANVNIFGPDTSNTSAIFVFGAQVEAGGIANPYVATTLSPVSETLQASMSMTYTFNFVLSPVEQSIVLSSGVLPKPAGVALTIVQT